NLNALDSIFNAGTIKSTGSLTMNAGGQIVNALPAGTTGPAPTIQAWRDVNLSALSGNITNSGAIRAQTANINVLDAMNNINFDNTNGVVSALKGNINLHDAKYTGSGDITLTGGDWLSKQVNVYAGTGDVESSVDKLTGTLNSGAGNEHLFANTPNL